MSNLPTKTRVLSRVRSLAFSCGIVDYVEGRGEFTDARIFDRHKIHGHGFLRPGVADVAVNAIARISGMSFDIKLGRPRLASFHSNHEMNVRRGARRVGDRFNCAKAIFAGRSGLKTSEALEVSVETIVAFPALLLQVRAGVVHLPDFNDRVLDRLATRVEQAPAQMRDFTNRRRDGITHNNEVVIRIERESVRVKRPFRYPRCLAQQLLGEQAGHSEEASRERGASEKMPAGQFEMAIFHKELDPASGMLVTCFTVDQCGPIEANRKIVPVLPSVW